MFGSVLCAARQLREVVPYVADPEAGKQIRWTLYATGVMEKAQ